MSDFERGVERKTKNLTALSMSYLRKEKAGVPLQLSEKKRTGESQHPTVHPNQSPGGGKKKSVEWEVRERKDKGQVTPDRTVTLGKDSKKLSAIQDQASAKKRGKTKKIRGWITLNFETENSKKKLTAARGCSDGLLRGRKGPAAGP